MMIRLMAATGLVLAIGAATAAAQAQPPPGPPPASRLPPTELPDLPAAPPIGAGEIQRLFDAYTMIQAQKALNLSEGQYGTFVTRLKSLQDVRRRHQQARNQILGDLRRLTNPDVTSPDEAALSERVRALREEDDRGVQEVRKAYEGVDQALDVRQQARFRVFEERMEQQKLELIMRARQAARPPAQRRGRL